MNPVDNSKWCISYSIYLCIYIYIPKIFHVKGDYKTVPSHIKSTDHAEQSATTPSMQIERLSHQSSGGMWVMFNQKNVPWTSEQTNPDRSRKLRISGLEFSEQEAKPEMSKMQKL